MVPQEGSHAYYHRSCVKKAELFLLDILNMCFKPVEARQSLIDEYRALTIAPAIELLAQ